METKLSTVSVLLPIRNEAKFIRKLLEQILTQDYPADLMEIIVCDGMSDDGTREIVAEIQKQHPQIRMIDNPRRIVPTELNAGRRVQGHG